tara:strand:+ start:11461 stop:11814 length:354 start_codon:yes stop_codon:yes gene_type:complete
MIKKPDQEDPMELTGVELEGDLSLMVDSIAEEYASIGWGEEQILQLFNRPFFRSTYNAGRAVPPEQLRARVRAVLARCGVVQVAIQQSEETHQNNRLTNPDLVQIQSNASATLGDSR